MSVEQTVSLKLGPELAKDFKIVVDLCYDGNYEEALKKAVVVLVRKEKFLCHDLEERCRVDFLKVVDKVFDGDHDRAVREAVKLLLEKCKAT